MTRTSGCVSAVQQLAADAGARMLTLGGNAVDAVIATAFAQGVVDPYRCGIGGGGMAMVRDPRTGKTTVATFYGCAPAAATPDMFEPRGHWGTLFMVEGQANQFGYRASVVPALSRGLADLLANFGSGRVTWAQVLEPAIELAADGYYAFPFFVKPMHEISDHPFLGVSRRTVMFSEASRAVFAPEGEPPKLGQLFRQPDYAATLQRLADDGVDDFYSGGIADAIAADFAAHGGLLTKADLASYRTQFTEPIEGSYRGLKVLTEPPPSIGPTTLQLLRILDGWDLTTLGFNSADYVDTFVRAANLVFQDRLAYIGDPSVVDVPLDMLLSYERAAEHRMTAEQMVRDGQDPGHAVGTVGHGSRDTTHVTVIDESGMVAMMTHSIGSGSGVVTPGLGFLLNNHMIQFDPRPDHPNSIAPYKHPNVGGGPVLLLDDDEVVLAMGSPAGGVKATAMCQAMVAINDFGFPAEEAGFLERFHAEDVPLVLTVDPRFNPRAVTELARRGYEITFTDYSARIAGVSRDPATARLTGITDPRGDRGLAYVPADQAGAGD